MSVQYRNHVHCGGNGTTTMVFAHGFGCDQTMWRFVAPVFAQKFNTIIFDLVGSGGSDRLAYDRDKYATLHGYADDLLEIIDEFATGPVVFVGHSVSATIGLLASIKAPAKFAAQVMIGPSPCLVNDGNYVGGFSRAQVEGLLASLDDDYVEGSSNLAPTIMGAPHLPQLSVELTDSFCRNDPEIARHFARVTFLADHRDDIPKSRTPTLILQSSKDPIAPLQVGEYMHRQLPDSTLRIIDNMGHCPHMSASHASVAAIEEFLATVLD